MGCVAHVGTECVGGDVCEGPMGCVAQVGTECVGGDVCEGPMGCVAQVGTECVGVGCELERLEFLSRNQSGPALEFTANWMKAVFLPAPDHSSNGAASPGQAARLEPSQGLWRLEWPVCGICSGQRVVSAVASVWCLQWPACGVCCGQCVLSAVASVVSAVASVWCLQWLVHGVCSGFPGCPNRRPEALGWWLLSLDWGGGHSPSLRLLLSCLSPACGH
ncbi:hypothetical protein P7K49_009123 [Saguinus oedipus]|uniref:Uncharacterized protein n=1 Tax=Saguinus oedipus TaxID=9490 RepID=A0ABQ9VZN8_SAGOE|nr:hypothetical protein P7K49_009123 [Saguinus oedipus]